jgi:hypothetical protein
MEEIKLSGSPAQLIAADTAEDDGADEGPPVRFHEAASDGADDGGDEPEPEQLSPEEKEERRQLIRKVGRYRALFAQQLSDINTSNLDVLPLQKLRDLSQDVEFLVATRRSAAACRSLFVGSLVGLETLGPYAGLELKGLSNVAAQSEDLLLTVDECAIKYESVIQIDPLARLAIGVGQLCLAIDAHNRRQRDNPPAAPVVTAAPAPTQVAPADAGKRADNINAAEFQDL